MATAQNNARALTVNEQAGSGYTHVVVVDRTALTETTNNTAMTLNVAPTLAGDTIEKYALVIKTTLQNSADAAFNSNTVSFGDAGSATRFISGVETNANGTYVNYTFGNTAYTYTSAGQLKVTVNAMSGKKLSDLTAGQVLVFFKLTRHQEIRDAVGSV